MIPQEEIASLMVLIDRLESSEPLTPTEIFYKVRDRRPDYLRDSEEQIAQKIERIQPRATSQPRNKTHPIFGDTHYALAYQVQQLDAHLSDWLACAHFVPPGPASRIQAILKRAKQFDILERFMSAYSAHTPPPTPYVDHGRSPDDPDALLAWGLQQNVPLLKIAVKSVGEPDSQGKSNVIFEFCCQACGGYIVHLPDDDDERGPAVCKACGIVFGSYGDVRALCKHMATLAVQMYSQ